jgi:hypothetical protein
LHSQERFCRLNSVVYWVLFFEWYCQWCRWCQWRWLLRSITIEIAVMYLFRSVFEKGEAARRRRFLEAWLEAQMCIATTINKKNKESLLIKGLCCSAMQVKWCYKYYYKIASNETSTKRIVKLVFFFTTASIMCKDIKLPSIATIYCKVYNS